MKTAKNILNRCKNSGKWIVLPEADFSEEIVRAGKIAARKKICNVIFLGGDHLKKFENEHIKVINIKTFEKLKEMQKFLFELRKGKGLTLSGAKKLLSDPNYFGVVMVKMGLADGMVSGKVTETREVLRPALQIIKGKKSGETVSSCMLMLGKKQNFVFSDCALVENPSASQICEIAKASAKTAENILKIKPKVALLSYSTMGSGKGESVDKILEAYQKLKKEKVKFAFDGPLQADAALIREVAKKKAPKSKIAGECNTLVFPNLDAGNIGYKLFRHASGSFAVGPILQGLARPVNDLSRGASKEEVLLSIAITVLQTY